MKKILKMNKHYKYSLKDKIKFGDIDVNILYALFKDGRIIGLLGQYLLENIFINITSSSNTTGKFDLINEETREHYEVKVVSVKSNTVDIAPSYMKGAGRKFDEQKFLAWLRNLDGFILLDVKDMPDIIIYTLTKDEFLKDIATHKFKISKLPQKSFVKILS